MVYSFVNIFKAEVQEASGGGPTGERAKSWYMAIICYDDFF